jgi:hypothetical protein
VPDRGVGWAGDRPRWRDDQAAAVPDWRPHPGREGGHGQSKATSPTCPGASRSRARCVCRAARQARGARSLCQERRSRSLRPKRKSSGCATGPAGCVPLSCAMEESMHWSERGPVAARRAVKWVTTGPVWSAVSSPSRTRWSAFSSGAAGRQSARCSRRRGRLFRFACARRSVTRMWSLLRSGSCALALRRSPASSTNRRARKDARSPLRARPIRSRPPSRRSVPWCARALSICADACWLNERCQSSDRTGPGVGGGTVLKVPNAVVGVIIGKGGETIKMLQQRVCMCFGALVGDVFG